VCNQSKKRQIKPSISLKQKIVRVVAKNDPFPEIKQHYRLYFSKKLTLKNNYLQQLAKMKETNPLSFEIIFL